MASVCISSCVDDTRVRPVRATYVNLYKWPESDFEFVRSMSSNSNSSNRGSRNPAYGHPRVVDSISCRQMYLRSYTFSREEDYKEKPVKCLGRLSKKAADNARKRKKYGGRKKKGKSGSCSALTYIFRRLLSCTTEINVAN